MDRHGKTERKEKEKGKKRMGASGPLVHDFVLAIMPFICIFSPFISKKPPPRGCRHCWPNHVKYCIYCRAFSPSNLCLIGLSHPIRLPSCPNSLLRGSVLIPLLPEFFWRYSYRHHIYFNLRFFWTFYLFKCFIFLVHSTKPINFFFW